MIYGVPYQALGKAIQNLCEGWTFGLVLKYHLLNHSPYQNSYLESWFWFWFQASWLSYA